ncbi:hypothetical protein [Sedimentibacter sp.]|uniref:hypothetical protein n=1 Tax=Sedimentibacter sp. TaxID=1960295 RepID=UPI00289D95F7|nr:hypothetical protein [Sedimentibacter sp.]
MSNTPKYKITNEFDNVKVRNKLNGSLQFANEISGSPVSDDFSKRENSRLAEKKIVNNKPSQFGPVLGVNFHMIKK